MKWEKLKTVNVTTASGEPDMIHFEVNAEGGFRIINDYGNECITFDIMTGLEMLSRFNKEIINYANHEIEASSSLFNNNVDFYEDSDSSDDCQGEAI